jgi:hypothetical protein
MKNRNYIIEPVPGSDIPLDIFATKIESVPDSVLKYIFQPGTG